MGKGMDPELDWASCSQRLKEVLGLRGSPVAIAYSNTPAPGASGGIYRACGAILAARDGEAINLASDNCGCKGGIYHLGLGPPREGLEAFLAYEERLFSSLAVARRMIQGMRREAPPPFGLAKFVVFSPLERIESKPDLVLFLCNPEQACRIVALAGFDDGSLPKANLGGSLCWSAITYPLMTGSINVSLGDITARRIEGYDPGELIVSVPIHKISHIVGGIDHCIAGTAKPSRGLGRSNSF
ncbi:MAG: DUF169 domain-containing protein [Candidatus Bathyarchaeia archaeon]